MLCFLQGKRVVAMDKQTRDAIDDAGVEQRCEPHEPSQDGGVGTECGPFSSAKVSQASLCKRRCNNSKILPR